LLEDTVACRKPTTLLDLPLRIQATIKGRIACSLVTRDTAEEPVMLDREVRVTEKCSADDAARAFRVFPLRPRHNHPRYGHTPKADICRGTNRGDDDGTCASRLRHSQYRSVDRLMRCSAANRAALGLLQSYRFRIRAISAADRRWLWTFIPRDVGTSASRRCRSIRRAARRGSQDGYVQPACIPPLPAEAAAQAGLGRVSSKRHRGPSSSRSASVAGLRSPMSWRSGLLPSTGTKQEKQTTLGQCWKSGHRSRRWLWGAEPLRSCL